MSARKISFKRRKPNEERVPVLPIHDKYDQAIQVKRRCNFTIVEKNWAEKWVLWKITMGDKNHATQYFSN